MLVEVEDRVRRACACSGSRPCAAGVGHAHPLVRLARVVQAEVVVDRLRREHGREALGERLQAVERAVAADADQPLDAELLQAVDDHVERLPCRSDRRNRATSR